MYSAKQSLLLVQKQQLEIADVIVDEMDTIFDAVTFYSDSKVVLSSYDLVDPSTDSDIRPQITCHLNRVTNDKLDPMCFERFSSWRSLSRAVARPVHVAHSFTQGNNCRGGTSMKGPVPQKTWSKQKTS